jgi:RNA polymerase sigma-70 factor, ECF subfamily
MQMTKASKMLRSHLASSLQRICLLTVDQDLIAALPSLRAFARSRAGSATDADDYVQQACLRVLNKREEVGRKGVKILPYAITIVRNLAIDHHRARKRQKTDTSLDELPEMVSANVNPMGGSGQGVSHHPADSSATINDTYRLIQKLPEYCREIMVMLSTEQTYNEIAESLGIKRNTIGTRALRCRKQLKELMDGAAA